jgi:hypothetical protein
MKNTRKGKQSYEKKKDTEDKEKENKMDNKEEVQREEK